MISILCFIVGCIMNKWNPDLYLKFKHERTQPSYDLVARIELIDPSNIVDIGCGPGNSTKVLRDRWPKANILGLDNSPEMVEKANCAYPGEKWLLADAASWKTDERYSIVFSNATLQWITGHEGLVKRLFALVADSGVLAVQVPANNISPLHQAVLRVSGREPWLSLMTGCDQLMIYHPASFYYDQLASISGRFDIWHTTYYHIMASHQDLIDWYSSTGMKSYLERIKDDEQRRLFQIQVLEECLEDYPEQQNRKILFPFQRLFFVAYKV